MLARLWYIVQKDLVSERRSRRAWPSMLLLGITIAVVFGMQMDVAAEQRRQMVGGMLWLAILFTGTLAFERSFASDREEGCWDGLLAYPIAPAAVYLAKVAFNSLALGALECLLIPLFAVVADVPLLAHPGAMVAIALLGNLGLSAAGTLLGALAGAARPTGGLSTLVVLPISIPVVLAAAEATRLTVEGNFGPAWWQCVQLLGAFAVAFLVAGALLFEFVAEE